MRYSELWTVITNAIQWIVDCSHEYSEQFTVIANVIQWIVDCFHGRVKKQWLLSRVTITSERSKWTITGKRSRATKSHGEVGQTVWTKMTKQTTMTKTRYTPPPRIRQRETGGKEANKVAMGAFDFCRNANYGTNCKKSDSWSNELPGKIGELSIMTGSFGIETMSSVILTYACAAFNPNRQCSLCKISIETAQAYVNMTDWRFGYIACAGIDLITSSHQRLKWCQTLTPVPLQLPAFFESFWLTFRPFRTFNNDVRHRPMYHNVRKEP